MTSDQQRIAIAEACGWTRNKFPDTSWSKGDLIHASSVAGLPNYLSDLNAMHEAEKVLTKNQRKTYLHNLGKITTGGFVMSELFYDEAFQPISATAAQRAEAFLRTLNFWKE